MNLLVATRNPHKLAEIRAILDLPGVRLVPAEEVAGLPEVDEDGATLEANAIKKARTLARVSGLWAIADDTGLEVAALAGAPGVYSARYAGEQATYADNNRKLLAALDGVADRRARFRTAVALADPAGRHRWVEGACTGVIVHAPRGDQGFGYDPLFLPDGSNRTFAEMDAPAKNAVSHRARAFLAARRAWADILQDRAPL